MTFKEKEFTDLINNFIEVQQTIQNTDISQDKELNEENENKIIAKYNEIIRYALPIWNSNDKDLIETVKQKLINIYYRLEETLKKLSSEAELPKTLAQEVKEKPKSNAQNITPKEEKPKEEPNNEPQITLTQDEINEPQEDQLQAKHEYSKEKFQTLIDEFDEWDRKVTRKNASEKPDIVQFRTEKIINAYNNLVEFCTPILQGKNTKAKQQIQEKLTTIRESLIDDLNILNANVEVPSDLTEKIQITDEDDETPQENSEKSSDDKGETAPSNSEDNTSGGNKKETTPAKPNDSKNNQKTDNQTNKMTQDDNNNFHYIGNISKIITNTYKGEPTALNAFIAAIELADSATTPEQQPTLVKFIKTKLEGKALEAIPSNAITANDIITALKTKIKTESSKVVLGRFLGLRSERNALTKFQKDAEELADQLRRAYISEGMTENLAEKTTIDKTVEMCRLSTKTTLVKSILASTPFADPEEVVAKLITETTTESNESQILYFQNTNRGQRNGQNYRGRQNFRGNANRYQNNNRMYRNGQQFRGRNNNYRGNGNRRFQNRNYHNNNGNQNNNTRQNRHVRLINEENGDAPAPQRGQSVTLAELQH